MAAVLLAFAYFVWPTPWKPEFETFIGPLDRAPYFAALTETRARVHRLTGSTQIRTPDGWRDLDSLCR
jgi:hypothetical protein